ncbi:hypothetical protein ACVWZA_003661 [Sphingomonas sp. UYAg733]
MFLIGFGLVFAAFGGFILWKKSADVRRNEMTKSVPDRYPGNSDSLGIELVGKSFPGPTPKADRNYESVTPAQNASLTWLVDGLTRVMNIKRTEIFRHPTVSQKTPSEASTARW